LKSLTQLAGGGRRGWAVGLAATALITSFSHFAVAQDRGDSQYWESDYLAQELFEDCGYLDRKAKNMSQCLTFIRSVAQASFWFDKCIPTDTSIGEIADVMIKFVEQNPQYADADRNKCPTHSDSSKVEVSIDGTILMNRRTIL